MGVLDVAGSFYRSAISACGTYLEVMAIKVDSLDEEQPNVSSTVIESSNVKWKLVCGIIALIYIACRQ